MTPLVLAYGDVILRDRIPADIADHRRWLTSETAWLEWDAPGKRSMSAGCKSTCSAWRKPSAAPRRPFAPLLKSAIATAPTSAWSMLLASTATKRNRRLCITLRESSTGAGAWAARPSPSGWITCSAPAATRAFTAKPGRAIPAWSGWILKCGFRESQRLVNCREVQGRRHDALTFVLPRCRFAGLPVPDRR